MNKLRDCAIVLGLAGAVLMVTADTKEVEATSKISYKSEAVSCSVFQSPGDQWLEEADTELTRILKEQEIEEQERQKAAEEQAERERQEAEQRAAEEAAEAEEEQNQWIYEVSEADYIALLKIVEAEASGEDLTGRILVANVVLNRVKSSKFPDTIEAVVYQGAGGKAQFSPVSTGKIERVRVSEETVEAVERALCGEDPSEGALYFVAPAHANPANLQWFRNSLTKLFDYHGHEFYT